jgi:hypothetical protein
MRATLKALNPPALEGFVLSSCGGKPFANLLALSQSVCHVLQMLYTPMNPLTVAEQKDVKGLEHGGFPPHKAKIASAMADIRRTDKL